jgi:ribosomal protein S26
LRKFLSSFPQTIRSLNLLNCESNQELNEKSVLALVQNNGKLIKDLNIENYFISPENFDLILENLDLSRLSVKFFSNRSLPMSSIQKMIEFQKSLTHLKLINCELKVDSNYRPIVETLNISSLELKNCLLKPNVFEEFVKLLKNLEILITNQFICCECYNPFGNECDICYEKCVKDMKKLKNIKVLRLKSCQIRPQFVESLVNFANLETIEVIDVYSQTNYCLSKRLIEVCVEIAKRDSNKLIKLKLIGVKDYAIDISIPENLELIYV